MKAVWPTLLLVADDVDRDAAAAAAALLDLDIWAVAAWAAAAAAVFSSTGAGLVSTQNLMPWCSSARKIDLGVFGSDPDMVNDLDASCRSQNWILRSVPAVIMNA